MADAKRQQAAEVQDKIRAVLTQTWDPIGVAGIRGARDEYDSYIGPVYRLLASGASGAELVEYLYNTETNTMGLSLVGRRHLNKVVARLREIEVRLD